MTLVVDLMGCSDWPNPYAINTTNGTNQSLAAQQVEADSSFIDNSYFQACGAGIVAAVLVAWATASGDDHSLARYLTAGGIGCGLALGANFMLQKVREGYKIKQEDKLAALNTVKEENIRLTRLISSTQALVDEDKRLLQRTEAAFNQKQISLQEGRNRIRSIDAHTRQLRTTLAKLEQRKSEWVQLQAEMRYSQTISEQQAMQVEIDGLEAKVAALKQELMELEHARSVSSLG